LKITILSVSDEVDALIYSPRVGVLFANVDLLISCGDLPYSYLEYLSCHIPAPMFFVQGNHVPMNGRDVKAPHETHGGFDLHQRSTYSKGILLAGMGGSHDYNKGPYQYTQSRMWYQTFLLAIKILKNRPIYGRFLDIFVTHAPPIGIHDQPDLPHQGFKAFLWFDQVFQPRLHLHGHIHYYRPDTVIQTHLGKTLIVNTFRYKKTEIDLAVK
jgi:uncharacterized protein